MSLLQSDEFRDSGLRVARTMEKFSSHMLLHKKHEELVPRISNILREMKKET